jgi:hypothetical protein
MITNKKHSCSLVIFVDLLKIIVNMKFIIAAVLMALASYIVGLFTLFPWYSFVFVVALIGWLITLKPLASFAAGFVGLFVLWMLLALLKDIPNNHILSSKVAQLLPLGGSSTLLIIITGIIGGLLGGLGALTGSYGKFKN